MPQYEVGHLERVAGIRDGLPAGIVVVGQAYDGVGVPDCVRAADETADACRRERHAPTDRGDGTMTDQPTTVYALYPVFKATSELRVELCASRRPCATPRRRSRTS